MRTSCLSTRASLSTSHARRKVDGGREALTAKPAGSLAITSERSSHVVSGQSKILSCIVRNIIKQVSPFLFSPEKPISPKAVKGLDVPQLTKNYYNVVSCFRHVNRFQKGHGKDFLLLIWMHYLFRRWCKTSWSMRESLSKNCRRYWAATCALFRPATSKRTTPTLPWHPGAFDIKADWHFGELGRSIKTHLHNDSSVGSLCRLSSADCSCLNGNLEDILSFQQGLCLALEECSK